jgi:hypothetical protein
MTAEVMDGETVRHRCRLGVRAPRTMAADRAGRLRRGAEVVSCDGGPVALLIGVE